MMTFVTYYGHVQNTSQLGESITISHMAGAASEVSLHPNPNKDDIPLQVPCWAVPATINKFGRRAPLIIFLLLTTVFGLGYELICPHLSSLRLVSALLSRLNITATYYICLQFASEIFPTNIRGRGLALCEMAGGVAILASPGVVHLKKYSNFLPLTILSTCSTIGLCAAFFLPETLGTGTEMEIIKCPLNYILGTTLPQTFQEADSLNEKCKTCHNPNRSQRWSIFLIKILEKYSLNSVLLGLGVITT